MAITSEEFSGRVFPMAAANSAGPASAVSWGAILAGAAAAAALSLILLILGTGLGLSSVSPWAHAGVSVTTLGVSTILWITVTQLLASGMGGYIAGRLRTKWIAVHSDEVHFRDTAHGFLAWCVASLATAALLGSVIGSILSGGIQAGAAAGGASATVAAVTARMGTDSAAADRDDGPMGYFVDSLFRMDGDTGSSPAGIAGNPPPGNAADPSAGISNSEVARIFYFGANEQSLPPGDLHYVGRVVARRTGLSQQDAEMRVSDIYARMQTTLHDTETATKEAADKTRKASAYAALWLFISLLIGAFCASLAATYGGRQRDL